MLLGYRLEVNGTTHCHLGPNTLSCTLTQCQPGTRYSIALVAITTTDKHLAKKLLHGKTAAKLEKISGNLDCDEAQSEVVDVDMPKSQSGKLYPKLILN